MPLEQAREKPSRAELQFVEVCFGAEGTARKFAAQFRAAAAVRIECMIARVVGERKPNLGHESIAFFRFDGLWRFLVNVEDADVFERVADATDQEVAAERAAQADACTGAAFVIEAVNADVAEFAVIKVGAQLQFATEKVRLDER